MVLEKGIQAVISLFQIVLSQMLNLLNIIFYLLHQFPDWACVTAGKPIIELRLIIKALYPQRSLGIIAMRYLSSDIRNHYIILEMF